MEELNLYFKVFGLGEDENGNPDWAGMKLDLGEAIDGITYTDIRAKVESIPDWRKQLLEFTHLDSAGINPEKVEIITPEEYERDYGDDD